MAFADGAFNFKPGVTELDVAGKLMPQKLIHSLLLEEDNETEAAVRLRGRRWQAFLNFRF